MTLKQITDKTYTKHGTAINAIRKYINSVNGVIRTMNGEQGNTIEFTVVGNHIFKANVVIAQYGWKIVVR